MKFQLFAQRTMWWPTWRFWLLLLGGAGALIAGTLLTLYGFLALNEPASAKVLVVEGWAPEFALKAAAAEFQTDRYELVVAAGGPMPQGYSISGLRSYAQVTAATLLAMGVPANKLVEAPAPLTKRNRTFESARQVRLALGTNQVASLNVFTVGPHARRTRLVYRRVFGAEVRVGVICCPPEDFEPACWWRSSEGVKEVLMEAIAWFYEALLRSGRSGA